MPVGIGLGVSAATTLGGAALQSGAAGKAADAARAANADTLAFNKGVYSDTKNNLSPTINQGQNAGSALAGLLGIGGNPAASDAAFKNYLGSTNYGFQLDQGLKGIEYANAPAFKSSATAKALNNYAQGQAGSALAGYEGLLSGQQTLGAQSALGLGQIGAGIGGTINNANQGLAGAIGSSAVYGATAGANALAGIGGILNQGITGSSFGAGGKSSSGGAYSQFSDLQ